MDKLTSIRIKYSDGTYLDEVPIGVLAQNVGYDTGHNLIQVLGSVDVDSNGTIQAQINKLFNEKVNSSDLDDYVNNQISTNVTQWLVNNVNPVGSAVMVDQSLSISGAAADSKKTGDLIQNLNDLIAGNVSGVENIINKLFFTNTVQLSFVNGTRGSAAGASVNVASPSSIWSCSNLIPASNGDIFTIINLMPNKYKFVIRSYTGSEATGGVFAANKGAVVLNDDLSKTSLNIQGIYSNTIEAIYKNTIGIIQNVNDDSKYLSVHVRRITGNYQDSDLTEINNAFYLLQYNPNLRDDFIPINTYAKRTILGDYGELFGFGSINIDTVNKTVTITRSSATVKSGRIKKNNPSIDFSGFNMDEHQTIYYDATDETIKITGYADYRNLSNVDDTVYLGSHYLAGSIYPKGYFSINTPMPIYVDGVLQLSHNDYNNNKTIGMFGDSILQGQTTDGQKTSYVLQSLLPQETGIIATNYALGGSGWCARSGRTADLCKKVPNTDISNYDYLLFFAGTNDYGYNRAVGSINDAPSNVDDNTFCSAVKYVIEYVFNTNPDVEVAIITPTFRNYQSHGGQGDAYTTVENAAGNTLGDFCDALVALGNAYNIPVYDMRKNSVINKLNYSSMLHEQSADSGTYLHPKNETYKIMNHKIIRWLISVL